MILGEGVKKILTKKMFAKMCAYRGKPPRGRMIFALRLFLKSFQSSVNCYVSLGLKLPVLHSETHNLKYSHITVIDLSLCYKKCFDAKFVLICYGFSPSLTQSDTVVLFFFFTLSLFILICAHFVQVYKFIG